VTSAQLIWWGTVIGSFIAASAASAFFAFAPISDGQSVLQANPNSGGVLIYPVIVSGLAVALGRWRLPRIFGALLLAPILLLIFSVGFFYAPAVGLMMFAAGVPKPNVAES
jgi:hypothetical protein